MYDPEKIECTVKYSKEKCRVCRVEYSHSIVTGDEWRRRGQSSLCITVQKKEIYTGLASQWGEANRVKKACPLENSQWTRKYVFHTLFRRLGKSDGCLTITGVIQLYQCWRPEGKNPPFTQHLLFRDLPMDTDNIPLSKAGSEAAGRPLRAHWFVWKLITVSHGWLALSDLQIKS